MSPKKFQKNIENFKCENCGFEVKGTGYTNHCPKCLWSKHVDVNPGDRLSECGGMMRPQQVEGPTSNIIILHQCLKCGHTKRNKVSDEDDFEKVIQIVPKN